MSPGLITVSSPVIAITSYAVKHSRFMATPAPARCSMRFC